MATGKNHQHGKYNGSQASPSLTPEYTEELHVKMCKKIAQLTKVIYALNLKVDEYEVNILTLKESHQNEMEQISNETKEKVLQYESMVGEEKNLRLQIQNLEEALEKNNMVKEQTLVDLALYKKQAEERELKTQCEQAERIAALSREMLSMKTDYESRLQQLTEEADSLKRERTLGEKEKSVEKLNEKLNKEIQVLSKEVESLKSQNHKLTEEYTMKTNKLHSNYIKEKESLRKALQQSVTEMIKQLQQKEQDQRKTSQAKEAETQLEVKQLKGDIKAKELEMLEAKDYSHRMQERTQDLELELRQRDQKLIECRNLQSQAEEELAVAKQRLLQQENELQSQIEQMKTVSNAHKAALGELAELKSQLDQQQQKPSRKTSSSKRDSGEAVSSKQAFREHSVPRQEHVKQHKDEVSKTKRQRDAEAKHLKEQLAKSREDLTKIHATEMKSVQMSMEAEKRQLQKGHESHIKELKKKNEAKINQLVEEKDTLYIKLQESICQNTAILQPCEMSSSIKSNKEMKDNVQLSSDFKGKETKGYELCDYSSSPAPQLHAAQTECEHDIGPQVESAQDSKKQNIQLDKCEIDLSQLEQENSVLRDSVELLSKEISKCQQEAMGVKEKLSRNQEELKLKQRIELDSLRQSHQQEIQSIVSKFSSAQTFLQAKIVTLEAELKEMEDKEKHQPRTEDLQFINSLQDKLSDKDQIIKHLLEVQTFDDDIAMPLIQETHRSQSFSCNPNGGSLTPTMKKKKLGEITTRVISVPNLAAYDKTFTNNSVSSKKPSSPIRTSPSVVHSMKPGYPFRQPAQLLDIIRPNRRNPASVPLKTEVKEQESKRPEWFTKYFSF
ncbi:PREDICTED: protein FAM184B-like [Nanorana parkeri]|uniref:protein FAM184B-like n=1 Tax=Nanorana parkeri TaxID=125878 RepID=UPI000854E9F2|nr:PREDICTED: protein FAM184B-like [Nanorana parkeri]